MSRNVVFAGFVLLGLVLGTFTVLDSVGGQAGHAGDAGAQLAASQRPRFGGAMVRAIGNSSVKSASELKEYPLYSLGSSYRDLPLVAVERTNLERLPQEPVREDSVSFVYGLCESVEGSSCAPPISVQVWNACERNRSSYDPRSIVPDEETRVRGVPAAFFEDFTRLELYTGKATVVLFSIVSDPELLRDAAASLKPVNVQASKDANLPPPIAGMMRGEATTCQ